MLILRFVLLFSFESRFAFFTKRKKNIAAILMSILFHSSVALTIQFEILLHYANSSGPLDSIFCCYIAYKQTRISFLAGSTLT